MSKISELSDGGSLTSTDYLIAVRSGGNVKVKMDTINVDQITLGDNEMIRLGNSQDLTMVHTSTQSIINQAGIGDLLLQKAGTTKASITANGLEFPDNSKAIFGAGSDLQIHHSGTNSYIVDSGDGSLYIQGSSNILLGSTTQSNLIIADGGAVTARYAGDNKLATTATGIDVTGTVTADGLTVSNLDSSVIRLESTGTGLGANAVIGDLQFYGNDASTPGAGIKASITATTVAALGDDSQLMFSTSDGTTNNVNRMLIASNGDISFYEDTGTTPKFFWDASAEALGIGTSSPSQTLAVESTSNNAILLNSPANRYNAVGFQSAGVDKWWVGRADTDIIAGDAFFIGADVGNVTDAGGVSAKLVIDSSGKVGIGTNSPSQLLELSGATTPTIRLNDTTYNQYAEISTANAGSLILKADVGNGGTGSTYIGFEVDGANEAMRIDASQTLLVGTTDSTPYNNSGAGNGGAGIQGDGLISAAREDLPPAIFNRLVSDGSIVEFRKDGSGPVGVIGTNSNTIYIDGSSSNTGLQFAGSTIAPRDAGALSDAGVDLGTGSYRFKDLYLSGGVVFGDAGGSGTSSSNTLDSYEEGTWTPTVVGGTQAVTVVNAHYTKIGRLVTLNTYIQLSNVTDATALTIGGFPFTADQYSATNIVNAQYNGIDRTPLIRSQTNTTNAEVIYATGNQLAVTQTDLSGNFIFTLTYEQL